MRHLLHRVSVPLALVALGGCGADDRTPGELIVRERLASGPVYIEGSISFLRVERLESGALVGVLVDGAVTDGREVRGRKPLFRRQVPPGDYRIESHQRPCAGNCALLDPPANRCRTRVSVDAGETVTATVVVTPGERRCVIDKM